MPNTPAQATPNADGGTIVTTPAGQTPPAAPPQPVPPAGDAEKPTTEGTETGKPPAKPAVPEKYDLKLPEGSLLEPSAVEQISSFAKEQGLSNEAAQKLLERESKSFASYVEKQKTELVKQTAEWLEAAKTDKEIGGEAFGQNAELAKRVVERYGSESFKKALNESGLGNHPELVRFVARIGKAMSEDQLVIPGTQSGGPKSAADTLYPNQPKEQ